jgi:hypothetical protein
MLALLQSLDEPHVEYLGPCVAGFDLTVATSTGGGTACWSWGSEEVEGPVRISQELIDLLEAHDAEGEDPEEIPEEILGIYRAMLSAKCRPGVDYFHILTSEDGDRRFSTSYDEVYQEWVGSAVDGADLTDWEDMEDEELEEWVGTLDLEFESDSTL